MRRKALDLVPLVDIMIVVLFIFATIEEGEHEVDAPEVARLREENDALRAALTSASAGRVTAELELDELAKAVEASRDAIDESIEARRRREIMKALLGEAQIVEIEIAGRPVEDKVENTCCFRRFTLDAKWKACGTVPTGQDDIMRWLDEDSGELLQELNAPGGTPTIVLVRQERSATYMIGNAVGAKVRERTPLEKTFSAVVDTPVASCTAPP